MFYILSLSLSLMIVFPLPSISIDLPLRARLYPLLNHRTLPVRPPHAVRQYCPSPSPTASSSSLLRVRPCTAASALPVTAMFAAQLCRSSRYRDPSPSCYSTLAEALPPLLPHLLASTSPSPFPLCAAERHCAGAASTAVRYSVQVGDSPFAPIAVAASLLHYHHSSHSLFPLVRSTTIVLTIPPPPSRTCCCLSVHPSLPVPPRPATPSPSPPPATLSPLSLSLVHPSLLPCSLTPASLSNRPPLPVQPRRSSALLCWRRDCPVPELPHCPCYST